MASEESASEQLANKEFWNGVCNTLEEQKFFADDNEEERKLLLDTFYQYCCDENGALLETTSVHIKSALVSVRGLCR